MDDFDPYTTLGISRQANSDEIQSAYKRMVKEWHPDKRPDDPNATERFKQISLAKDILTDATKRKIFDKFGINGILNPDSLPRDIRKIPPQVLFASCCIDLLNVDSGTTVQLPVERHVFRPIGDRLISVGTEVVNITVPIPQGIEDDMQLTIQNEGHRFEGETDKGPVRVVVKVAKHTTFKREGHHLILHVPVNIPDVIYPTIFKLRDLKENDIYIAYDPIDKDIPISPDNNVRIVHGKGLPLIRDPVVRGDLYVVFDIALPPIGYPPESTISSLPRLHTPNDEIAIASIPESCILSMVTKPVVNENDGRKRQQVGCVQQ